MMTLSGMSVVISINVPPGGAAFGRLKLSVWRSPLRSVSDVGDTDTVLASIRNVPTGELPAALLSVT